MKGEASHQSRSYRQKNKTITFTAEKNPTTNCR